MWESLSGTSLLGTLRSQTGEMKLLFPLGEETEALSACGKTTNSLVNLVQK